VRAGEEGEGREFRWGVGGVRWKVTVGGYLSVGFDVRFWAGRGGLGDARGEKWGEVGRSCQFSVISFQFLVVAGVNWGRINR